MCLGRGTSSTLTSAFLVLLLSPCLSLLVLSLFFCIPHLRNSLITCTCLHFPLCLFYVSCFVFELFFFLIFMSFLVLFFYSSLTPPLFEVAFLIVSSLLPIPHCVWVCLFCRCSDVQQRHQRRHQQRDRPSQELSESRGHHREVQRGNLLLRQGKPVQTRRIAD